MHRFDSITLASSSPRRRELLHQIGVDHDVQAADIDERQQDGEDPAAYVTRLASQKAQAVWARNATRPVLAADTAVVLDGQLYAKPADQAEGLAMLRALSGKTHQVLTAIALRSTEGLAVAVSASDVSFRDLAPDEQMRYWASGEPLGKAGGYAIQGLAACFITRLVGSYSGVMGLPLAETAQLLTTAGVRLWHVGAVQ
jgi:septum formation protein